MGTLKRGSQITDSLILSRTPPFVVPFGALKYNKRYQTQVPRESSPLWVTGNSTLRIQSLQISISRVQEQCRICSSKPHNQYKLRPRTTGKTYRSSTIKTQKDQAHTLRVRASNSALTVLRLVLSGVLCNRGRVQETGGRRTFGQRPY